MTQPVDALWTRVICKQPGRYIGWPTIARSKTGDLLAVFSGDREEHICPWGKTHLVRSSDDGVTWDADNERIVQAALNDDLGVSSSGAVVRRVHHDGLLSSG